MCGIVSQFECPDDGSASLLVYDNYSLQKMRGQQGFGFVTFTNKEKDLMEYHKTATSDEILKLLGEVQEGNIMFHHRLPTSTDNVPSAAHPIYVSNSKLKYDYYVVHNGVIRNSKDLKKKHEDSDYKFKYETVQPNGKFNDSEALAVEFSLFIEENKPKIEAIGSQALVAIQVEKQGENSGKVLNVFYYRKDNPLHITYYVDESWGLTSEEMVKGCSVEIPSNLLHKYNFKEKKTETSVLAFAVEPVSSGYTGAGGYSGYTSGWAWCYRCDKWECSCKVKKLWCTKHSSGKCECGNSTEDSNPFSEKTFKLKVTEVVEDMFDDIYWTSAYAKTDVEIDDIKVALNAMNKRVVMLLSSYYKCLEKKEEPVEPKPNPV